jgi:branched-chain amino acid transport system substrate-binding protein
MMLVQSSKWYTYGWHTHNALRMLVEWVNTVRGGIRISTNGSSTIKRKLQIITVDDGSLDANIAPITKGLIDGSMLGPMTAACGEATAGVDFVLGPYSSGLTELAARVTNAQGKLLMAPAASATSVFTNRSLAFGMPSPAATYMHAGIDLLHTRQVKTIAILSEDGAATKDWCKGAADKAKQLNITVVASVQVSEILNRTEIASALAVFRAALPDAVVGCTYYDVCAEFLKQANATRFYTQASLFTICVTDPKFGEELADIAAYVLGVTPWSEYDTEPDQIMGWSAADFALKYKDRFQEVPIYQAVAAFAGGLLLTAAIEEAGSLEAKVVAQKLFEIRKRTVYGATTFSANRQNLLWFATVQRNQDLVPSIVNASNIIFPTPSWERRNCEVSGICKTAGGCNDNGDCVFNCKAGQYLKGPGSGAGRVAGDVKSCVHCPAGFISTSGLATRCTGCMPGGTQH